MKSAILVVLLLQVQWALSCTFQREEVLRGEYARQYTTTEGECFAKCLNHEACIGLCYRQGSESCYLFDEGDKEQPWNLLAYQCYYLHRDSAKPPQYSRKLSFVRKNSLWRLA